MRPGLLRVNLVQRAQNHVVHLDPNWALPVVFTLPKIGMRRREASDAVR